MSLFGYWVFIVRTKYFALNSYKSKNKIHQTWRGWKWREFFKIFSRKIKRKILGGSQFNYEGWNKKKREPSLLFQLLGGIILIDSLVKANANGTFSFWKGGKCVECYFSFTCIFFSPKQTNKTQSIKPFLRPPLRV